MSFAPDTLRDRVAIITGGGTGIGKGIALEMAKVGAKIAIASRSMEHLEPTAEEVRRTTGQPCIAVQTDVRDWDQCQRMAQRVLEEYGRIDILVNNAAGNFTIRPEELTVNGWNAVIGIDLNGTWFCSRAVFPAMKEQRKGSIINILAFIDRAAPLTVHAGAAKAGIWSMTMSLAVAWGPYGIRVNGVTPGGVPTLGTQRNLRLGLRPGEPDNLGGEEAIARMQGAPTRNVPLGRTGTPRDIALACIFLASDLADWITGVNLWVDGGGRLGRGLWEEGTPRERLD